MDQANQTWRSRCGCAGKAAKIDEQHNSTLLASDVLNQRALA
ncbi:hypothetical protein RBSWK_06500 [Rhodopirellula baltica SWK14]|uniref:Uncharacterized protein n=1 Tax=Rhodopirellula baltica SWK14 TaxID=993516 RepID=L7C628_RHOBT|nr:hypothetical protein RBSWK_06500 [Rhodopirellula baltica SWK14]